MAEFPIPETASLEARLIISGIYGSTYFGELLRIVKSEYFSVPENRRVWDTIVDMYNKGEQIDVYYDPEMPEKYACRSFGRKMNLFGG